jgi:class 3 adenylate cyclase
MDVRDWLRVLDLGQYETAFRENSIDWEVLRKLTAEDLKELGIVSVGHRRKLLASIEELSRTAIPIAARVAETGIGEATDAERRHLTVMFVDLVGSTAVAARLDPEDMREVFAVYHKCCAGLIRSNGGFVAKYMGDGVLAYFGYPRAHEHDAENALCAALAIVAAAPRLNTAAGAPLHARVGVATGVVVVGDLVGAGEAQEHGIVGDPPNLAARLQGIAKSDSVVIAESTRRLVGDLFELEDLGLLALKGVGGPTRAFAVLRTRAVESRFEALHGGGLTPLVGREAEIEILLRLWAKAKKGEGQAALVAGEAGIGKSRLAALLAERLADEPHVRMRYFCSPQHVDSAFYPIIHHLERTAGFMTEDEPKAKLDKLDTLLARNTTSPEDSGLIADLLSLGNDGRYPLIDLPPQHRRKQTLDALVGQIEAFARTTPALLVFEDAHWSDSSSVETLDRLFGRIAHLNVLAIVTFRPDFAPPWTGRPYVTALTLNRLTASEIEVLIERVAGNRALPESIRGDIIERADGVPLFAEEIAKAAVESEDESEAARVVAATPSPVQPVPASLHASLMARLDRLGAAKEVAQIGAAIGRDFSHGLIAAVAAKSELELADSLDRLVQAGLLFRQGVQPNATYLFKHALVQDAAYGMLLRSRRQQLHARIVTALEGGSPVFAETQPEILARHCAEARHDEKAIGYWRAAGEKAARRASNREAIGHFSRALALVEKRPLSPSRSRTELAILSQLGPALMNVHGWSAPDVGTAFERAECLARQLDSSVDLAPPLVGLWLFRTARGQFSHAEVIANEVFNLAHDLGDRDILLQAHHCAWAIRWFRGDFIDAKVHADAGLNLYDEARHVGHRFLFLGHDPAVCALSVKSILQWLLGHPTEGLLSGREAIALARRLRHAPSFIHALWFTCQAQIARRDSLAVIDTANELIALSEQHGLPHIHAAGLGYLGWALSQTGDVDKGVHLAEDGITGWDRLGLKSNLCFSLCLQAETYFSAGRSEEGLEKAELGVATSAEIGDRWCLPRTHMIRGRLLQLISGDSDAAEQDLRAAVEIARSQCAKGSELRATTSLARLWRDQGKRQEAHDLLAPTYSWFTEGFDTLELKEAKALLDELAS